MAAAAAVAAVVVLWIATRGRTSAFPAWLGWSLTNPLADRLFGTTATLDRIGLRPGQRALEIGPGPGRLLVPAARRVAPGGDAVGLELQPAMVERLRRRAAAAGVRNLTGVVGDAAALPFAPGSFDVVFLVATLGEIADREAAMREVRRVLAPGGSCRSPKASSTRTGGRWTRSDGWPKPRDLRWGMNFAAGSATRSISRAAESVRGEAR